MEFGTHMSHSGKSRLADSPIANLKPVEVRAEFSVIRDKLARVKVGNVETGKEAVMLS